MNLRQLFFPNKPWLFKKQIHDDIFGMMWFNKDKMQPEYNHYQGHFKFKPTQNEIDIFIDSDQNGISSEQKNVFKSLENKYHDFVSKIILPLQDKLRKRKSTEVLINDFNSEFQLFAISISKVINEQHELKLSYSSDIHSLTNICVTFRNDEVAEIDG